MSYLTDDEKRMEFNMRKAQYFLGMQCSLNKGDGKELKELLNELIDDALQEGKKQGALEELNWIITELFEKQQIYPFETKWIEEQIRKRIEEFKKGVEK